MTVERALAIAILVMVLLLLVKLYGGDIDVTLGGN